MKNAATFLTAFFLMSCAAPQWPAEIRYRADIRSTECVPIEAVDVPENDGLSWSLTPYQGNPPKILCWEQVTTPDSREKLEQMVQRCSSPTMWSGNACIMGRFSNGTAWVLSTLTLEEARGRQVDTHLPTGKRPSVFQHELAHVCANFKGLKCVALQHTPESFIRPLIGRW